MTIDEMINEISVDREDMEYYKEMREELYKLKELLCNIYKETKYGKELYNFDDIRYFIGKDIE